MQLNISQASGNWRYKWVCVDTSAQILLAFGPGSMQDLHIFPPPIFPSFPGSQGHMVQLLSLKTFTRTHSLRDTLLWVSDTLGCQTASKEAWEESWTSQPQGSQLICHHPALVLRPTTSQKAKTFAFSLECLLLWCSRPTPQNPEVWKNRNHVTTKPFLFLFPSTHPVLQKNPSAFQQWTKPRHMEIHRGHLDLFWPNWGYQVLLIWTEPLNRTWEKTGCPNPHLTQIRL